jgi:hypothetical protein
MYPKWISFFITSLVLVVSSNIAYSQIGTEFWFVAPDITQGHADTAIYLRVSSYDSPTTVTISQPANTGFTAITLSLASGETKSVNLSSLKHNIENTPPNTILNHGIKIQSTSNISAYYEVQGKNRNQDLFTLKSGNALGEHFIIPIQSFWENTTIYAVQAKSSFEIVATEDSTYVEITPSNDIIGHAANTTFGIWLNQGQTYSAAASAYLGPDHLHGSEVKSSKPIAITISDDSVEHTSYAWCRDLMGDQIVPINKLGNEYIVLKGFLTHPYHGTSLDDRVFITAVSDSTVIYLDGSSTATATIQKGEQHMIILSNSEVYIQTSKNVYVTHVTGFRCEVGISILPPLGCTGLDEVSFTRSSSKSFYLIVLVKQGGENGFEINGNNTLLTASDFSTVSGTGGQWMKALKEFTTSQIGVGATLNISNSSENFHVGVINQGETKGGAMYGYFSHFGTSIITDSIYHY